MKEFKKEEAFEILFKMIDEISKIENNPAKSILAYVKLADFLEKIARESYENGYEDAVENSLNSDN